MKMRSFIVITLVINLVCINSIKLTAQVTMPFTDNRDGQVYKTVTIDNQVWMAENLNYKATGFDESFCFKNDENNCRKFGKLYSYHAAKKACPSGWHLPSMSEWTTALNYLGGESVAGGKMKSTGSLWLGNNYGATNSSGFSAVPGGKYTNYRFPSHLGKVGHYWSSDCNACNSKETLYGYAIHFLIDRKDIEWLTYYGYTNFSVRCLKDNNLTSSSVNYSNDQPINSDVTNTVLTSNNNQTHECSSFFDNRDGKQYKTVKIGNQTWMAENLAYKANNGCHSYENEIDNIKKYGYLYSFHSAKTACPIGWHLPSDNDWKTLEIYYGISENEVSKRGWRGVAIGGYLKEGEFSLLAAGRRMVGIDQALEEVGYYWSSTQISKNDVIIRTFSNDHDDFSRYEWTITDDLSVRCIKD